MIELFTLENVLFISITISYITPLIILIFFLLNFLIKRGDKFLDKFVVMIFLSVYTFQPNIIKNSFNTLNCKSFYPDPGAYLLQINLLINCNSESYIYWISLLIVPNLIIFGIIYPMISLIYVWRKKIHFSASSNPSLHGNRHVSTSTTTKSS